MRVYRKTPWYWYGAIALIVLAISIAINEVYSTKLPVYGVFLAFLIPAIYMVPCGIIQGITNVDANQLNVLAEFVGGYLFNGKPLANIVFKILSTDVVGQVSFHKLVSSKQRLITGKGLIFRPRHEVGTLPQGPTTNTLLCSRKCNSTSFCFLSSQHHFPNYLCFEDS